MILHMHVWKCVTSEVAFLISGWAINCDNYKWLSQYDIFGFLGFFWSKVNRPLFGYTLSFVALYNLVLLPMHPYIYMKKPRAILESFGANFELLWIIIAPDNEP